MIEYTVVHEVSAPYPGMLIKIIEEFQREGWSLVSHSYVERNNATGWGWSIVFRRRRFGRQRAGIGFRRDRRYVDGVV